MDRLRRSLRDSFRRKKDHIPECSKPHQWQADEAAVRAGTCSFPVKVLEKFVLASFSFNSNFQFYYFIFFGGYICNYINRYMYGGEYRGRELHKSLLCR